MKTLNFKSNLLLLTFASSIILSSCKKNEPISPNSTSNVVKQEIWPVWYLVAAVVVIVKSTEGQGTTTTTTNPDGSSTSTTTCTGLGSCSAGIHFNGDDIGNENDYNYAEDYSYQAEFGLTDKNDIILKVNNDDPKIDRLFYADQISFLTNNYIVDNTDFLNELGLENSFEIKAGNYDVYQHEDFKYIILGSAN